MQSGTINFSGDPLLKVDGQPFRCDRHNFKCNYQHPCSNLNFFLHNKSQLISIIEANRAQDDLVLLFLLF